ncbi:MAG: hydantoinase/oxoprolinase family protein [bacterium]
MTASNIQAIGLDTGGTFTDYIARYDNGDVETGKVSSSPDHPADSIRRILDELNCSEDTLLVHGTTVGTNALLENQLADVVFLTNEGLTDLLSIGRGERRVLYELNPDPENYPYRDIPVVEVPLRDHPFLEDDPFVSDREAARIRRKIREWDPDVVAVTLVHSYRDSTCEKMVQSILNELSVDTVLSSDVLPVFREFERASTTVVTAGLAPVVSDYLDRLTSFEQCPDNVYIMRSDRGVTTPERASARPVDTVLSGPAAGLVAGQQLAEQVEKKDVITMDIGGTSTDVCLMPGKIPLRDDHEIGGYPIGKPMVDIHTIGSGGGSIIRRDKGGHLRVGPQSAGADPGPACYGNGGPPTVTDALVIQGKILTDFPLSEDLELSYEASKRALEKLTRSGKETVYEIASGVLDIVYVKLAEALREVSVRRGLNPGEFTLYCYGGGGGLYGASVADRLGIPSVHVPRRAGITSARGLLNAPECVQENISPLRELDPEEESIPGFERLQKRRPEWAPDSNREVYVAECQFAGQTHPLRISLQPDNTSQQLHDQFLEQYRETYGYLPDENRVELVHLSGLWFRDINPKAGESFPTDSSECGEKLQVKESTEARVEGNTRDVPVYPLETLDTSINGPALLPGKTTTVFVPPGWFTKSFPEQIRLISNE